MSKTVVALYEDLETAQEVLQDLIDHDYRPEDIGLARRDPLADYARERDGEIVGDHATDGAGTGAEVGGALGAIAGILVGLGAVALPALGPVIAAGPLIAALAGAGVGAAAGSLVGALVGLGIPQKRAAQYAEAVRRGGTLVTVSVLDEGVDDARRLLARNKPVDVDERARQWRSEGWTGLDQETEAQLKEEAARARARRTAPSDVQVPQGETGRQAPEARRRRHTLLRSRDLYAQGDVSDDPFLRSEGLYSDEELGAEPSLRSEGLGGEASLRSRDRGIERGDTLASEGIDEGLGSEAPVDRDLRRVRERGVERGGVLGTEGIDEGVRSGRPRDRDRLHASGAIEEGQVLGSEGHYDEEEAAGGTPDAVDGIAASDAAARAAGLRDRRLLGDDPFPKAYRARARSEPGEATEEHPEDYVPEDEAKDLNLEEDVGEVIAPDDLPTASEMEAEGEIEDEEDLVDDEGVILHQEVVDGELIREVPLDEEMLYSDEEYYPSEEPFLAEEANIADLYQDETLATEDARMELREAAEAGENLLSRGDIAMSESESEREERERVAARRSVGAPSFVEPEVRISDLEAFEAAFRQHYDQHMADSGYSFEECLTAYEFGMAHGGMERMQDLDWEQMENEIRTQWERDYADWPWDTFCEAVREGWYMAEGGRSGRIDDL